MPLVLIVVAIGAAAWLALRGSAIPSQGPLPPPLPAPVPRPHEKTYSETTEANVEAALATGISVALSALSIAGSVAAVAGVATSVVVGYAAAIAVVVIISVVSIVRGVQDAQWVSDSLRKGEVGLLVDLGNVFGQIATRLVAAGHMTQTQAHAFAFGMSKGYNKCAEACVRKIPWATAFTGWDAHLKFWNDRAMYLSPDVANQMGTVIKQRMGMLNEPIDDDAYEVQYAKGEQFGIAFFIWCWGRGGMLEPWQYAWFGLCGMLREGFGSLGFAIDVSGNYLVGHQDAIAFLHGEGVCAWIEVDGKASVMASNDERQAWNDLDHHAITQKFGPYVVSWSKSRDDKLDITEPSAVTASAPPEIPGSTAGATTQTNNRHRT